MFRSATVWKWHNNSDRPLHDIWFASSLPMLLSLGVVTFDV